MVERRKGLSISRWKSAAAIGLATLSTRFWIKFDLWLAGILTAVVDRLPYHRLWARLRISLNRWSYSLTQGVIAQLSKAEIRTQWSMPRGNPRRRLKMRDGNNDML